MILISERNESMRQTERERERERLDTDTRILCAHVYMRCLAHTIKDILTPTNTEENVCE
jgi:hypothetical protein